MTSARRRNAHGFIHSIAASATASAGLSVASADEHGFKCDEVAGSRVNILEDSIGQLQTMSHETIIMVTTTVSLGGIPKGSSVMELELA